MTPGVCISDVLHHDGLAKIAKGGGNESGEGRKTTCNQILPRCTSLSMLLL
jgi:hypothetical protein